MADLPVVVARTGSGVTRSGSLPTAGAALAIPLGLLALWTAFGPARVADGVPSLVAGWTLALCGLLAWRGASPSRIGPMLVAASIAWFIPDFGTCLNVEPLAHRCLRVDAFAWPQPVLGWAWLAILGAAIMTYASGRADGAGRRMAVIAIVISALSSSLIPTVAAVATPLLLVAAPLLLLTDDEGPGGPEALAAPIAGVTLAVGLVAERDVAIGLDAAVILTSVVLLLGVTTVARRAETITADRAVGLGPALATALGDPTFQVAIPVPGSPTWVDTTGRPIEASATRDPAGAEATAIEREGILVARITHDPGTLADPEVRAAVETAVELSAHNVRLRADLAAQLAELEASRRRLVDAGLREGEALGRQVDSDVLERITVLERRLATIAPTALPDGGAASVARAIAALEAARVEIRDLARGLAPASLAEGGLADALRDLAVRSSVEVDLDVPPGVTGGPGPDATVYFVCAEALANVARHARASHVRIVVVATETAISVVVGDDGAGGADPGRGSGLLGLEDRVAAMGGTLKVASAPGTGTRLAATIPIAREALSPA